MGRKGNGAAEMLYKGAGARFMPPLIMAYSKENGGVVTPSHAARAPTGIRYMQFRSAQAAVRRPPGSKQDSMR